MSTATSNGRTKVDRIPSGTNYEGYLWESNEEVPDIYHVGEAFEDDFEASQNPFIVEGWLYDAAANKSYAIRYLDGQYLRVEHDLSVSETTEIKYQAHDLKDVSRFKVVEHWVPEDDDNCAGMPVLRHAWTAFAGFVPSTK